MIESELFSLVTSYGLPTVLVIYLLITRDKIIKENTGAINNLQKAILLLSERFRK